MSKPRALIVEDNLENAELASFVLDEGFIVDAVSDATDVMRKVASFRPDVILMDIKLGGGDGLSLTRQLKADPATAEIVVIAFTAFAMKDDEAQLRSAGCDAYIAKPIDVTRFADEVLAAMAAKAQRPHQSGDGHLDG
ncbi:response regulator [Roseateles amylovorans]|uniref:Response regulator n=1 Tax=Roseateles amylovorans TaxID=2978473 RepID=A0ABY6AWX4_9BURK|nr:response regulator [Roseateles amylovorans]UXH77408.1 response regulator [Roseateles amylovorans]